MWLVMGSDLLNSQAERGEQHLAWASATQDQRSLFGPELPILQKALTSRLLNSSQDSVVMVGVIDERM
jgi:hypothetical protein